jgi:hypothetical protein
MESMEAKFRPLPLSIIDFFGVVVPGFIWLILLVTAVDMIRGIARSVTPATGWRHISRAVESSGEWLGPLVLIFLSFLIGYAAKPRAMALATRLGTVLIRNSDRRFRELGVHEVRFPFRQLHEGREYYKCVLKLVTLTTDCDVKDLPGPQPFTVVKQLLRLIAPALWEELEHREAEIRLLGVTFLAAVFSTGLIVAEIIRQFVLYDRISRESPLWFIASLIAAILLGFGFGYLRVREVDHAYINALIAVNARRCGLLDDAKYPKEQPDFNA